jgi:Zn-dependent protease with chaperone function
MPFLLLLFLTLACLPDVWPEPWGPFASPFLSATLSWLGVALLVGFARGIATYVTRRLPADPGRRERTLSRYSRLRTYHLFLLLGGYALVLYVVGWGWTVQSFCGRGNAMLPGAELLILAPFLAGLVLSWLAFYDAERAIHDSAEPEQSEAEVQRAKGMAAVGLNDRAGYDVERALHDSAGPERSGGEVQRAKGLAAVGLKDKAETAPAEPFWSRAAYVGFHVRQNLALVFAPLLLLLLMKGLHRLYPESEEGPWGNVISGAGVVLSLSVIVGMPWVLRLALGLKPLPPGPLRRRLEATARRLHFRCSNILLWKTNGGVANAMVVGVVPWVRYVILTDRLMTELTPDEVEAVFGHEMGHVKHHHMLYYLGFLGFSIFVVAMLWSLLELYLPFLNDIPATLQAPPLVTMLGAYIFVVFGFLSRRCERQADVYGCRAVSCASRDCCGHEEGLELAPGGHGLCPTGIRTFIEALEKVARLNGIPREKPGWLSSWQHSTIARRVEFLQGVLRDQSLERHFQRRVALVKCGLFLGLVAVLGVLRYLAA